MLSSCQAEAPCIRVHISKHSLDRSCKVHISSAHSSLHKQLTCQVCDSSSSPMAQGLNQHNLHYYIQHNGSHRASRESTMAQWLSNELLSLDQQRQYAPSTEEGSTEERSTIAARSHCTSLHLLPRVSSCYLPRSCRYNAGRPLPVSLKASL